MGQFRRLVFEYALKAKSKDEVFDQMLQLAKCQARGARSGPRGSSPEPAGRSPPRLRTGAAGRQQERAERVPGAIP